MASRAAVLNDESREILEYRDALERRTLELDALVADLQNLFFECSDQEEWAPSKGLILGSINACRGYYPAVETAVRAVAGKEAGGKLLSGTWVNYFWAVFYNQLEEHGMNATRSPGVGVGKPRASSADKFERLAAACDYMLEAIHIASKTGDDPKIHIPDGVLDEVVELLR